MMPKLGGRFFATCHWMVFVLVKQCKYPAYFPSQSSLSSIGLEWYRSQMRRKWGDNIEFYKLPTDIKLKWKVSM